LCVRAPAHAPVWACARKAQTTRLFQGCAGSVMTSNNTSTDSGIDPQRLLPRTRRHPLQVYAGIEAAIALCGLLELVLIPLIDRLYISGAQEGVAGMLTRGVVCAVALLPPTVLMGASLPAIVRWARSGADLKPSWWGLLYGANTM